MDFLDLISHSELCSREGLNLQRGMNYQVLGRHSVILMSLRNNAPDEDEALDDGSTIIHHGHDVPGSVGVDPKSVDQAKHLPSGAPTKNGKFYAAAKAFANGNGKPRRAVVRSQPALVRALIQFRTHARQT